MTLDERIAAVVDSAIRESLTRLLNDVERQAHTDRQADCGKLLWRETEAAALLGISPLTLKKWREQGEITAHRSRRPILYSRANLDEIAKWLGDGGGA